MKSPEYILEIAKQKNLTRAAQALFVTQSTLSQHLIKVEQELGTPLFVRGKKQWIPTEAGEIYLRGAQHILKIQENTREHIANLEEKGVIRVGITSQWGVDVMTDLLPEFGVRFPKTAVHMKKNHFSLLKDQFQEEELDLLVTALPYQGKIGKYQQIHLRWEELALVLPENHPFALSHPGETRLTPQICQSCLKGLALILSEQQSTLRSHQEDLLEKIQIEPQVSYCLNSNYATLTLVARGMGCAVLPLGYAKEHPGVRVFSFQPGLQRENILLYRKDLHMAPAIEQMIQEIVSHPLFCSGGTEGAGPL